MAGTRSRNGAAIRQRRWGVLAARFDVDARKVELETRRAAAFIANFIALAHGTRVMALTVTAPDARSAIRSVEAWQAFAVENRVAALHCSLGVRRAVGARIRRLDPEVSHKPLACNRAIRPEDDLEVIWPLEGGLAVGETSGKSAELRCIQTRRRRAPENVYKIVKLLDIYGPHVHLHPAAAVHHPLARLRKPILLSRDGN